jgi:hypothetical protein
VKVLQVFIILVGIVLAVIAILLWFPSNIQLKLPTLFNTPKESFSFSDVPSLFPYYEWREVSVAEQQLAKDAIVVAYQNIENTYMELPGREWVSVKQLREAAREEYDEERQVLIKGGWTQERIAVPKGEIFPPSAAEKNSTLEGYIRVKDGKVQTYIVQTAGGEIRVFISDPVEIKNLFQ